MTSKAYWLMKTEPGEYSFDDLVRDGQTFWSGVRNHQAKKNLMTMAVGDEVLIYHSVTDKAVTGIAKVSRTHYPDPTDPEKQWVVVDIKPVKALKKQVTLAEIKATPQLADIALVRQARLSVMPLEKKAFEKILSLGS